MNQVCKVLVGCILWCAFYQETGSLQCRNEDIKACEEEFSRNSPPACKQAIKELPRCLYLAYECRDRTANGNVSIFTLLEKKVKMYHTCATTLKKEKCNEVKVRKCYNAFDKAARPLCPEARKLRDCINHIKGCHVMRNPFYTLSVGLVHAHFSCFIKNYSVILKAYENKEAKGELDSSTPHRVNVTIRTPVTCVQSPRIPNEARSVTGYKFFGAVFVCALIVLIAIIVFVFIRRTGLSVKQRRSALMVAAWQRERRHLEDGSNERGHHCRRSSNSQRIPMTTLVDEDDAPPPYYVHSFPSCSIYVDSPPPYTSRPSSVNGDFV